MVVYPGKMYNREECAQLAVSLADEIKLRAKRLDYKRSVIYLLTIDEWFDMFNSNSKYINLVFDY